ncbi:hypothetical protein PCANC_17728 [Puccinia coronata f. sp. avenae]|uniref:Uncharacterized protein n=1 Tax=Puccinia coronata f. sp. avenae TaxID=200324 RepID=A0A2N5U0W4_9BASI|nr:hypothetical protein PCANC_17728 [Puccinia coronata f. sp. avenae]
MVENAISRLTRRIRDAGASTGGAAPQGAAPQGPQIGSAAPIGAATALATSLTEHLILEDVETALVYKEVLVGDPAAKTIVAAPEKSNLDQLWDKIVETLTEQPAAKPTAAASQGGTESKSRLLEYIDGSIPTHFDIGFTPFFDKKIKELKGPLPLTIFNKDWQEDAMNFHLNKKTRSDKKEGIYSGFEYPNEWTQTFANWTSNFCNFLITFRDIYKNEKMGSWIEKHKSKIDKMIADYGFMVGFRYVMWVRVKEKVSHYQGLSSFTHTRRDWTSPKERRVSLRETQGVTEHLRAPHLPEQRADWT